MGAPRLTRCTPERSDEIVERVREIARDRIQTLGLRGRVTVRPNGDTLEVSLSVPGATHGQRADIEHPMQDYLGPLCTPKPGEFLAEVAGYSIHDGAL